LYTRTRSTQARYADELKRNWLPLSLLSSGVLIIAISLYRYAAGPSSVTSFTNYSPEDTATSQPILAVHEMNEGPPIPFLPKSQPQPSIQVPEKFYSFGTIGPKDKVEHEFIIRNIGQGPLTISRTYSTCGCATTEISANVIPPGKVAAIRLVFDTGFHVTAGQIVRRGLMIENNDPEHFRTEIWVQAEVRSN
jgi:hypothetical protein